MKRGFLTQKSEKRVKETKQQNTVRLGDSIPSEQKKLQDVTITKTPHFHYLFHAIHYPSGVIAQSIMEKSVLALLHPEPFEPLRSSPAAPLYRISSAGDKGMGMFATRDIPEYTLILTENPIIVTPFVMNIDVPTHIAFKELFARLGDKEREKVLQLHDCYPTDPAEHEMHIAHTNNLTIEMATSSGTAHTREDYSGIFPDASRCNHSCGPNAYHVWDSSSFSGSVYSMRKIRAGEEITLGYVLANLPREMRRAELRDKYFFECTCTYCSVPDVAKSDYARSEIVKRQMQPLDINAWIRDRSMPDDAIIKPSKQMVDFTAQEGLEVMGYMRHVNLLVDSYAALADKENFKYWVKEALQCPIHLPGVYDRLQNGLKNPKGYPTWGVRRK